MERTQIETLRKRHREMNRTNSHTLLSSLAEQDGGLIVRTYTHEHSGSPSSWAQSASLSQSSQLLATGHNKVLRLLRCSSYWYMPSHAFHLAEGLCAVSALGEIMWEGPSSDLAHVPLGSSV